MHMRPIDIHYLLRERLKNANPRGAKKKAAIAGSLFLIYKYGHMVRHRPICVRSKLPVHSPR